MAIRPAAIAKVGGASVRIEREIVGRVNHGPLRRERQTVHSA